MKKDSLKIIDIYPSDKPRYKLKIQCLEDGEEGNYNLLGIGTGLDWMGCFSMGVRKKVGFVDRVIAYKYVTQDETSKMLEEATGKKFISVKFFELR